MNFHFYDTTTDAWRAMLAAIKGAKKSVYWESYIFETDIDEYDFIGVLKDKAKEGLVIKIIVDSYGGFFTDKRAARELENAGVEVLFYNRLIPWWNATRFKRWWLHRNHKKMLIVDEKKAFIGGVNVGKRFRKWLDLQVELRGALARYLIRSFAASYEMSGGKDEIKYPLLFQRGGVKVFHHSPLTERGILKNYYKKALKTAKNTIVIVTPYFIPQKWLIKLLKSAVKRGVKIEVILSARSDYRFADFIGYNLASLVYRSGIRFFFTKETIHAKAFLLDDREAMVGSQNIDAFSFDYNLEAGIIFEKKDMIDRLKKIIDKWKRESRELTFANNKKKWYQRLVTATILWLTPYL